MSTAPLRIVEGLGAGHGVLALPVLCDDEMPARAADIARAEAIAELGGGNIDERVEALDRATMPSGSTAPHVALAALSGRPAIAVRSFPPRASVVALPAPWRLVLVTPDVPWDDDTAHRALVRSPHAGAALRARVAATGLVLALERGDGELLRRVDDDRIVAHALGRLLPGLHPVLLAARAAGALLAGPDGYGPAIAALCPDLEVAADVGAACVAAWHAHAIKSTAAVRRPGVSP